ncbi:SpoIID/LytB domain-containing protein [candidate division WOR-3 bacterium]|uniref:SpoIID/LytB domain-containing protein n=1 Tax=candidate division WOR-3 bacterium TaxID=2052148 RepID=A0A9D5QCL3_UNCW3|nr:SpoIID/LytB domain-containing protein [candidate division WOR-3 bacterium]MBD3364167.1 SpoIID/LytB domain-containing protein [candidate division WOR-3 bacterium]
MSQLLLMLSLFSVSRTFTIRVFANFTPTEVTVSSGEGTHTIKASGNSILVDGKEESYYQAIGEKRYYLTAGDVKRSYAGGFTFFASGGELFIINYVPEQTYLASVVTSEMPDGGIEARKAQAILARTYAYKHMGNHDAGYELLDSQLSQVYRGLAADQGAVKAVEETEGLVLGYKGKVADIYYHSTCGGMTILPSDLWRGSKNEPYHRRVVDTLCSASPLYTWEDTFYLDTISQLLNLPSIPDSIHLVRDTAMLPAKGFVFFAPREIKFEYRTAVDAWDHRPKTRRFDIEIEGNLLLIHGHGYGHGVGMCQYGAMGMAKRGDNYRDILSHYFPGTQIMAVSRLGK